MSTGNHTKYLNLMYSFLGPVYFSLRSRHARRTKSHQVVPSKNVNYRYMSTPEKISQMRALRRENQVLNKRLMRLKDSICCRSGRSRG